MKPGDVVACVGVFVHLTLSSRHFHCPCIPLHFFFALCKINNSGLQTQRVEGENIHGGKNYSHALYLAIASRIVFQGAQSLHFLVGGEARWCCMTHTHTHAHSAVPSCVQPLVEIELTAFAFCPKVLGTQTGSLVSPCLQQG